MTNDLKLQHPDVNGGVAVTLQGAQLTVGWKNNIKYVPVKSIETKTEIDRGSWENPKININGSINVDDIGSNTITQDLLIDFAKVTITSSTSITLTGDFGSTNYVLRDADKGVVGIPVRIDAFNINVSSDNVYGHFWSYSISLMEDKS